MGNKKPNYSTMNYTARRNTLDTKNRTRQLDKIYKRDHGICQICMQPCDRADASRGHIKDFALCTPQEARAESNMQLEHKDCNNRKSQQTKKHSGYHKDSEGDGLQITIMHLLPDFPWEQWTEDLTNESD